MEGISLTPQQEKLKALKEILPEAFAEGKIDWEKLKATFGEDINFSNERYVLNWAGKSDAFKVLQTPSTKTLIPCPEESVKADGTAYQNGETFQILESDNPINPNSDNIFIEGENLEVLKVLQKSYFGKVKMIYIDPPYNTGNDSFIYPDKFSESKAEYEKRVGDKDEEGYMTKDGMFKKNSKENGQYHSNWLNMMMPRLYLAKNLLRQDGVIFVSIDDNEVHNLRLLMNEIFGEENFVANMVRKRRDSQANLSKNISPIHEYILIYGHKDEEILNKIIPDLNLNDFKNPDNDPRGSYVTMPCTNKGGSIYEVELPNGRIITDEWRFKKETFDKLLSENRIVVPKGGEGKPRYKLFFEEKKDSGVLANTWLDKLPSNQEGTREIKGLFDELLFDTPKPYGLIEFLIKLSCNKDSLILDFFAGSGTTAHAVMELNKDGGNRKYICVQLPELCDEKSEAYKAGYKTIAEISKERIRRAGKKIQSELGLNGLEDDRIKKDSKENQSKLFEEKILESSNPKNLNSDNGFKVLKLADSNFKQWQQIEGKDAKALTEQMQLFIDPVSESATIENMVYEFLLKSGKDLNSKIEKRNDYFVINNSEMIMLLESISQTIIEAVIGEKPMKVIALDKLFTNNDQLKTNTVLQMRDAGIEFKTV
jgi:adenine-specific DNA-methyltransferase